MKKTTKILLPLILLSCNIYANELDWVDEQIKAIKPPRVGLSSSKLDNIKTPFLFVETEKNAETKSKDNKGSSKTTKTYKKYIPQKHYSLYLQAIMNNSVRINRKWYKLGDKIYGYRVIKIEAPFVTLVKNHKYITLSTKSKKKILKFSK